MKLPIDSVELDIIWIGLNRLVNEDFSPSDREVMWPRIAELRTKLSLARAHINEDVNTAQPTVRLDVTSSAVAAGSDPNLEGRARRGTFQSHSVHEHDVPPEPVNQGVFAAACLAMAADQLVRRIRRTLEPFAREASYIPGGVLDTAKMTVTATVGEVRRVVSLYGELWPGDGDGR